MESDRCVSFLHQIWCCPETRDLDKAMVNACQDFELSVTVTINNGPLMFGPIACNKSNVVYFMLFRILDDTLCPEFWSFSYVTNFNLY